MSLTIERVFSNTLLVEFVEPDPVPHEGIRILLNDEEPVKVDFSHAHFAICHQGTVLPVDDSNLKESLIIFIIQKCLSWVFHILLVLLLSFPLIKTHHVWRNQAMLFQEVSETLPLCLFFIEIFI